MKMAHADNLNLYLITFNCGREFINPDVFAPRLFDGLGGSSGRASTGASARVADGAVNTSQLPDLIVFNLQEVAPIAYSFLGGSYLAPYLDRFARLVDLASQTKTFGAIDGEISNDDTEHGSHYVNVISRNLGLTAIMVFVRSDLVSQIHNIMTAGVGVGVHETGNKGAVGVRLGWRLNDPVSSSNETDDILNLTFVSAHLAPMEEELQRRNKDFHDIVKGLIFTSDVKTYSSSSESTTAADTEDENAESAPLLSGSSDDVTASPETSSTPTSLIGMYTGPTHLFFAGDLNYRTSAHPPSTAEVSSFPQIDVDPTHINHYSQLLKRDQLNTARSNNETLHGLTEEEIHFTPTYKYKYRVSGNETAGKIIEESDTKSWEWAPHRWPSWCDRILYFQPTSQPKNTNDPKDQPQSTQQLTPHKYTSLPMMTTSDHRPVTLSISLPLTPLSKETSQQLSNASPVQKLDPNWRSRRTVARRREIAVGLASYLALTREGNALVVGGVVAALGAFVVSKSFGF